MSAIEDTWLIVPLYNEERIIGDVIAEARKFFLHIICVDDGSHDDSAKKAHEAGAVVIVHPLNLGQGAALQTGFEYFLKHTDGRFAITFDGDGQHRVEDAIAMRACALSENLSIIFGSRFLDGATKVGFMKRCVLKVAVGVTKLRTGMQLSDAHNGLRLLQRDAVQAINLQQNRMAHASEIVIQLARSGLPWREIPVHIRYTDYSLAKGQSLLNSINILIELIIG